MISASNSASLIYDDMINYKLIDFSDLLISNLLGPLFIKIGLLDFFLEFFYLITTSNNFIGLSYFTFLFLLPIFELSS